MKITKGKVQHIASLARLEISEKEVDDYQKHLEKFLENFSVLEKVDVSKVEAIHNALDLYSKRKTQVHLDIIRDSLKVELALSNAPATELNQFKVAVVIEES